MSRCLLRAFSVAILSICLSGVALSDDSDRLKPGEFETEITLTIRNNYLLHLPKDYEKQDAWPLLIFLHGAGERGDDLEQLKVHGPPKQIAQGKEFPCVVLAAQCQKHTQKKQK